MKLEHFASNALPTAQELSLVIYYRPWYWSAHQPA